MSENTTDNNKDDDYLNSVLGFTYTIDDWAKKIFLDQIFVTMEYAFEWRLDQQNHNDYVSSSESVRAGKNDFISRVEFKYNEDLLRINFVYFFDV